MSLDSSRLAPQAPDSSFGTSRAYATVPPSCAKPQERAALADHGLNTACGQDHVMVCTGMIMYMGCAPRVKASALAAVSSRAAGDEGSCRIRTWLRPGKSAPMRAR